MSRKRDIKQFRQACKEAGLNLSERFKQRGLHAEKKSGKRARGSGLNGENLLAWLRQWNAKGERSSAEASPLNVLRSMPGRGPRRGALPEVRHVEIRTRWATVASRHSGR